MRIALDVMGGDFMPQAPIEGALRACRKLPGSVRIVLVGDEQVIRDELARQGGDASAFDIVHAAEVVLMSEHPAMAIKGKPNSSINIGIGLVRKGLVDAFISAGNTGAMTVASVLGLGLIEGVSRPTLGAMYPCDGKLSFLSDVGANVDCKPEHLVHFALLGSIFMEEVMKVTNPRVRLLNVGEEKSKGNQAVQEAYKLLEATPGIQFLGNAEGRDFNAFAADVYICDGFVGNILLKYMESLYSVFKPKLPSDSELDAFNFEHFGALPILGVKGNSLVGHGISSGYAFENMIYRAREVTEAGLVDKIRSAFSQVQSNPHS